MSNLKSSVSLVSLVVLPIKERADKQIQFENNDPYYELGPM